MMGRALLILGWLATVGILATAVLGYLLGTSMRAVTPHVLTGLVASLLLLFSHCWVMFYLIGTGTAIKNAVRENSLDEELAERTKGFKSRSYPWLMLAMGLVIATFVAGGAYLAGVGPSWIHEVLFFVTLVVQAWTLVLEGRVLMANERLMDEINRQLA
jgi:hypothetical protein